MYTDDKYDPTLTLIYLPHLDYCLQKFGPDVNTISKELKEIDAVVKQLVEYYTRKNARIVLLSEYGITPVSRPVHINRVLRKHGLLEVRIERGLELLDPGASKAFAVADHQVAHIYINDPSVTGRVRDLLKEIPGVELVLDEEGKKQHHINHARAGDLVVMADEQSWFTYYFWEDDEKAPDYARVVDIHKKPGYDPVEMFMTSKLRAGYKLLRKKAGFRYVMDVIPLDATLIKGSHGRIHTNRQHHPVLVTDQSIGVSTIAANKVYDVIWDQLIGLNYD